MCGCQRSTSCHYSLLLLHGPLVIVSERNSPRLPQQGKRCLFWSQLSVTMAPEHRFYFPKDRVPARQRSHDALIEIQDPYVLVQTFDKQVTTKRRTPCHRPSMLSSDTISFWVGRSQWSVSSCSQGSTLKS